MSVEADQRPKEKRADLWFWAALGAALVGALGLPSIFLHRAATISGSCGQGFPVDDAWIHSQFALNFARGHFLEFHPGIPSSGSTSPLWSLLEGGGLILWPDPVTVAHALGIACFALLLVCTLLLGRRIGLKGPYLLVVVMVCASRWRLVWASVSGMEVCLMAALVVGIFAVHIKERESKNLAWLTGLLAGLAVWVRPEGILALPILLVDRLVSGRDIKRPAAMVAAFAALAAPLGAWNISAGPGVFPQTVYTKEHVQSLAASVEHFFQFFADLAGPDLAWQGLVAAGLFGFVRAIVDAPNRFRLAAPALFALAYLWAIASFRGSGGLQARYLLPCLPLVLIYGLWLTQKTLNSVGIPRLGLGLAAGALAVGTYAHVDEGAETYARNVASVSGHVVAMGRWIDEHVPTHHVIAMSDVGAMSYLTEHPVVDMRGLVSPYFGWDRLAELERQRREGVSYAALFPEANERVILRGEYIPIHAITLEQNNISATDNLALYRTAWADRRELTPRGRRFDFELGETPWTVEGEIDWIESFEGWDERPTINLEEGRFLTSNLGGGDTDLGRAVSPPFIIEGDIITLRVGGGDDTAGLGVRLWVAGNIVRTAVGARSSVLVQREWDVREHQGQNARIEVRDESTEPWGHITVDAIAQHLVNSGEAPELIDFPLCGPQEPAQSRRHAESEGPLSSGPRP